MKKRCQLRAGSVFLTCSTDGSSFIISSWVVAKLVEDDYAILRKFEGRSLLATYLSIVVARLVRDWRTVLCDQLNVAVPLGFDRGGRRSQGGRRLVFGQGVQAPVCPQAIQKSLNHATRWVLASTIPAMLKVCRCRTLKHQMLRP